MSLVISRPDKVLFPDDGLTKADLADYYQRISGIMLPYLKGRPLTLHRFPEGIHGVNFIQKNVDERFPDWMERVRVAKQDGTLTHALANNADDLRFLVDQGTIALHIWLSRKDKPRRPDRMIFDLDPAGEDFPRVIEAARTVRELLQRTGLESFPMTTGSSGMHVVVPLDRSVGYNDTRAFAQTIADIMVKRWPRHYTTEHRTNRRGGRLYLDVQRNAYAQTGIAPYSVRALPCAPIATPLDWHELDNRRLGPRSYHIGNIFRRLAQRNCPWTGINRRRQSLSKAARQLQQLDS